MLYAFQKKIDLCTFWGSLQNYEILAQCRKREKNHVQLFIFSNDCWFITCLPLPLEGCLYSSRIRTIMSGMPVNCVKEDRQQQAAATAEQETRKLPWTFSLSVSLYLSLSLSFFLCVSLSLSLSLFLSLARDQK
jgi:hypothetical protein